ncbi:ABC transporter substrate-binding protein [Sphingomonas sp. MMS24-J45]|uniref:ABC transporter substrate-binding protein n=1 Tax=Sphingomonas sp. MMS24-J45 TaxID=3238806 RepID=UPI0038500CDD
MRLVPLLAVLLAGCAAPARGPASGGLPAGGIVSTNPCADAMLVELAPERLSAISQYSHNPAATSLPLSVARRFPSTAGTAEEVIALRPSLVVTSSFTPLATRDAYRRAGLKTLLLDSPATVAASEAQIALVAEAVGQSARGRAMIARIEQAVARAAPRDAKAPPSVLLFIGGTLANGPGNLLDELMARAGLHNAAKDYGLAYTAPVALESIAAAPPALILTPGPSRNATLRARVLNRMHAPTRYATFARTLINCGGPTIVPAVTRLAELRRGEA